MQSVFNAQFNNVRSGMSNTKESGGIQYPNGAGNLYSETRHVLFLERLTCMKNLCFVASRPITPFCLFSLVPVASLLNSFGSK